MGNKNREWMTKSNGQVSGPYALGELVGLAKESDGVTRVEVSHPKHTDGDWVDSTEFDPIASAMAKRSIARSVLKGMAAFVALSLVLCGLVFAWSTAIRSYYASSAQQQIEAGHWRFVGTASKETQRKRAELIEGLNREIGFDLKCPGTMWRLYVDSSKWRQLKFETKSQFASVACAFVFEVPVGHPSHSEALLPIYDDRTNKQIADYSGLRGYREH
tara:strand:+ start:297 stop:947 length:651 start_codon:yes stop_codon:yes gene_type:complete